MINLSSIEMYNLLRNKIGETEAQAVTEYITVQVKETFQSEKEHLATKEDIAMLRTEIAQTKAELLKWMFVLFTPFYIGMIVFLVKQFM